MKTFFLFVATALAEIVGCHLAYLWLKQKRSILLLIPAALSLAFFAGLLTLHLRPGVYARLAERRHTQFTRDVQTGEPHGRANSRRLANDCFAAMNPKQ